VRQYVVNITRATADPEDPEVTVEVLRHGASIGTHTGGLITALEWAETYIARDYNAEPLDA